MYVEGEVQDGSPFGQFAYIAIGRKDKYLARRGFCIETLRQRVRGLLQRLTQTAQPLLRSLCTLIDSLISPMCRDTSFCDGIHTLRANLYLHPATFARRDGSVQRLVAILLRDGHPIAHTLGVGRVAVAHHRVYCPAELLLHLALAVDYDAQCEDIVNTFEADILLAHLIPYRVDRLGAALDVILQVGDCLQALLDGYEVYIYMKIVQLYLHSHQW